MQNTDVKTKSKAKSKAKRILISFLCVLLVVTSAFISFGGSLGIPNWNDVFTYFGVYADLGDDFSASFVDVATADACCIRCHDKNILIDSGTSISYDKLSAYLKRNNFKSFDAVIISHLDSDHFGGLIKLLYDFEVKEIYMPKVADELIPETEEYGMFLNSVKENKVEVKYPTIQSEVTIGDMSLNFISPVRQYDNRNDNSLVVKITYKETSFLFTGDISEKVEEDLVNSNIELKADVLKVAHHGSKTSSSEDFLKAVSPQISVVSVGTSDDTLPDYETMVRINHYSDSLYRTDKDKTIIITSNGNKLKIQTNA